MDEVSWVAAMFDTHGTEARLRSGHPLRLEGEGEAWRVEHGAVDLFLSRVKGDHLAGALHPVGRRTAGQLLWGLPTRRLRNDWCLVALGTVASKVRALTKSALITEIQSPDDRRWLAQEQAEWSDFLRHPLGGLPPEGLPLPAPGDSVEALASAILCGGSDVAWVQLLEGRWAFLGAQDFPLSSGWVPLGRMCWLTCLEDGRLRLANADEDLASDRLLADLGRFHDGLWIALVRRQESNEQAQRQRLQAKLAGENARLGNSLEHLAAAIGGIGAREVPLPGSGGDALFDACRRLGQVAGIDFVMPPTGQEAQGERDRLAEITEASRVRRRRITLSGEWWRDDGMPLLTFTKTDGHPVVLLPSRRGYLMVPPGGGPTVAVDARLANELVDFAWTFYRGLTDTFVSLVDLLRFGSRGGFPDYVMVSLMGLAIGLIGMVTPMATGMLFDSVIPGADRNQLLQLTLALVAAAFGSSLFEAARGFAVLRAQARLDISMQSALWDRLVRLPASFFRDYSAGDLATRANGINQVLQMVSGQTLQTMMGAVFSSFNLILLFYYNLKLGLLALVLVTVAMVVTVSAGLVRLRHERQLARAEGQISGLVLQLLSGIAKLRSAGAEARAFNAWAMRYGEQQAHSFRARLVGSLLDVFNGVFPMLSNMLIFGMIAFYLTDDHSFSTGQFLAFNAAFGGFLGAMLAATSTLMSILNVVPIYERARPILETATEVSSTRAHPGILTGDIEVSHLSFSYTPDGPLILRDLDIHIRAGEFVAIVGASGSGKSTLLRLLLGFEQPTQGFISYDRQNLAELDPGAVRRQLGVVLQNGQLMSGDIFSNIVGSVPLTIDDAWLAAERAGIAADIRAMPMGMHTVVSEGGSTLSGGQRQRLMIARAIVRRPRLLFFDEATSALDNQTQAMVSSSLKQLKATRIVIAHRLSTIIHADRILVMEGGQIVQSGSYGELIGTEGLFADLARRQVI
jgi:ATP-binding cassette subfamily C protein